MSPLSNSGGASGSAGGASKLEGQLDRLTPLASNVLEPMLHPDIHIMMNQFTYSELCPLHMGNIHVVSGRRNIFILFVGENIYASEMNLQNKVLSYTKTGIQIKAHFLLIISHVLFPI